MARAGLTEREDTILTKLQNKSHGDISRLSEKEIQLYGSLLGKHIAASVENLKAAGVSDEEIERFKKSEIKTHTEIKVAITQPSQPTITPTPTPQPTTTSQTSAGQLQIPKTQEEYRRALRDYYDQLKKTIITERNKLNAAPRPDFKKMSELQKFEDQVIEAEKKITGWRWDQAKRAEQRARVEFLDAEAEWRGYREYRERLRPYITQIKDLERQIDEEEKNQAVIKKMWERDKKKQDWQHDVMMHDLGRIKERAEQPVEEAKAIIAAKKAEEDRPHEIRMAKLERAVEKWGRSTEEMKKRFDVRRAREFRPLHEREEEQKFEEEYEKKPWELLKKESEQPVKVAQARMEAETAKQDIGHKIQEMEEKREKELEEQPLSLERLIREREKVGDIREQEDIEHKKEYGGIAAKTGAFVREKWSGTKEGEGWKKQITAEPGKVLAGAMDTFGKGFKTRYGAIGKPFIKNSILFAIYFPIAIWSITSLAAPILEGWFGMPIVPSWFVSLISRSFWIVMAGMFGIMLPSSLVLGKTGLDFDYINKGLLTTIAVSASMWGAQNLFIPTFKANMPNEYAMMMCLMKYSGNMQICATNQTQQVQVQKIGTYETLDLTMGVVTPTRTIPPMNPVPGQYPYYFTFTLKNTNEIGSPYNISVTPKSAGGILVAATQSNFNDVAQTRMAVDYPYYPVKSIEPGGYVVAQARFDSSPGLPDCTPEQPYTYFHVNITTDQNGGGSTKMGLIENDDTIDNQNFMFFFDPDVKTQPGPVDIYVYTVPFVLPSDTDFGTEPFLTFIPIENKGSGSIESIELDLVYDSSVLNIAGGFPKYCTGTTCNVSFPIISTTTVNNLTRIKFQSTGGSIKTGETYVIYNTNGALTSGMSVVGKSTGLISVVANYRYRQQFNEQIGCIQTPGTGTVTTVPAISTDCAGLGETDCINRGVCEWCSMCNGQLINDWRADTCVDAGTSCGYNCGSACGAQCETDSDCPFGSWCGAPPFGPNNLCGCQSG